MASGRALSLIMVNWSVVAAFIGPLIGAIGLAAGFFAYLNKVREKRIGEQIAAATASFETNQRLLQEHLNQVDTALITQGKQIEKQNDTLIQAVQAIARIEGRLSATAPAPQNVINPLCGCYASVTQSGRFSTRIAAMQQTETATQEATAMNENTSHAATRAQIAAGLQDLADFILSLPDEHTPYTISVHAYTTEAEGRQIRKLTHSWIKSTSTDSDYITYTKNFTPALPGYHQVRYSVNVDKNENGSNCTRVQVGTRHVEATEAYDEPVYEWQCGDES